VLVVTHNLAQAKRIADEVALFWVTDGAGQLIESGSICDYSARPNCCFVNGRRVDRGDHP